jgi:hypothetical protein
MDDNGRLEPSFADAITAIEQSSELPPSRLTHWVCSLRRIAKALDRPPESLAARWGAVAQRINRLHHVGSGVEWKTLANHKSNATANRGVAAASQEDRGSCPSVEALGAHSVLQHEGHHAGGGDRGGRRRLHAIPRRNHRTGR